jgi:hypothetical protein
VALGVDNVVRSLVVGPVAMSPPSVVMIVVRI